VGDEGGEDLGLLAKEVGWARQRGIVSRQVGQVLASDLGPVLRRWVDRLDNEQDEGLGCTDRG
jgi:hypothetical protein